MYKGGIGLVDSNYDDRWKDKRMTCVDTRSLMIKIFGGDHGFMADDVRQTFNKFLYAIYPWESNYRNVKLDLIMEQAL